MGRHLQKVSRIKSRRITTMGHGAGQARTPGSVQGGVREVRVQKPKKSRAA